jgi:hypothetical protein
MARRPLDAPSISDRALNRATLMRQGLLAREAVSVEAMLHRLIGMQGQVQNAPYIGLWTRLEGFVAADLEALLKDRRAVRATIMRSTLHVALAEDFLAVRPLIDPVTLRTFRGNHVAPLKGADIDAVRKASRVLLDAGALRPRALGEQLQARWPEVDPIALSMPARFLEPVVHVPPAGLWGATGMPELTSARRWLGREPGEPIGLEALMLRYLAGFGPASGSDFNAWSGLTGGSAVLERLRPRLVSFAAADGREVFDLPDAPRPPEDTPAPVRLLPDYDNVVFGYAERGRILSPESARGLWRNNGQRPAFLVDGSVRGCWRLTSTAKTARLELSWFTPLRRRDEADLRREGMAMLKALLPGRAAEIGIAAFEGGK